MGHTPHELDKEFPEYASQLTQLKQKDGHLARLANDYSAVNTQIYKSESSQTPVSDETLEQMKKKRLLLKDEIAALLKKAATQAA